MNHCAADADLELPPPPERPDCCFGGCAQCVLDDYAEALARWQAQVEAMRATESKPRRTQSTTLTTAAETPPSVRRERPS